MADVPALIDRRALLVAAAGAPALGRAASASSWPERPVRIGVPFTPGGTTDILARALGAELQEVLGQPVVVENRGGAGGTVGTEAAARAAPDGHTLLMGHIGTLAVNPALYPNFPFDTASAFEPVVLVAVVPNVLVVNPRTVEARSVRELVALAKRKPRGLSSPPPAGAGARWSAPRASRRIEGQDTRGILRRRGGTPPALLSQGGGLAMLTRRGIAALAGAGAAWAAAGPLGRSARAAAVAGQTPVDFDVPPGACDCHFHVFPDPARFPLAPNRVYTTPVATAEDAMELHRLLRLDRAVVVQPSVYGTDNRAMLDAIRQLGPRRTRGVAIVDGRTTAAQLDEMGEAGVRGVQVNLEIGGIVDPAASARRLQDAVRQVAARGWHVQTLTRLTTIEALKGQLMDMPVPLVVNHFGNAGAEGGVEQPGFAALLELVRAGKAYVKVSGAHHISRRAPDFPDAAPLARALIEANPDRILWGTNWPHPDSSGRRPAQEVSPFVEVDDGRLFNELPRWAPDAAVRRKILVDNPARLYGFG